VYYFLLALISAALFGAATPASKALLASLNSFQLAGLLYLGAALGGAAFAFRKGNGVLPWRMNRRNLSLLAGAIIFGGVLAPLFLLFGLRHASAASVSLWLPLELVATAVLGRLFFHDHLGVFGWLGMTGVVIASLLLGIGEGTAGLGASFLVVLSCICWGFDNNFTALIDGITPAQSTFWKGLVAGLINLSLGYSISRGLGSPTVLVSAMTVGILAYGVSIILYITAAQNIGAARAQIFFASGPFFGMALSAIFLSERISTYQIAAALLLIGSLSLVFRDRHEHQHQHQAAEHEHVHEHDDNHHEHAHNTVRTNGAHSHRHSHESLTHSHPHWPDLHHRHEHK
jgi:drug/metabolite transporter (DMT)-like permease